MGLQCKITWLRKEKTVDFPSAGIYPLFCAVFLSEPRFFVHGTSLPSFPHTGMRKPQGQKREVPGVWEAGACVREGRKCAGSAAHLYYAVAVGDYYVDRHVVGVGVDAVLYELEAVSHAYLEGTGTR